MLKSPYYREELFLLFKPNKEDELNSISKGYVTSFFTHFSNFTPCDTDLILNVISLFSIPGFHALTLAQVIHSQRPHHIQDRMRTALLSLFLQTVKKKTYQIDTLITVTTYSIKSKRTEEKQIYLFFTEAFWIHVRNLCLVCFSV